MKIKSLKIQNFRCFKNLDVEFEHCHTLIGPNGAGKTTILEAINLATAPGYSSSRISEEDFNIHDAGDILIEVEFDKPFVALVPDGYATQKIPCNKVRFEANRRLRAGAGKALSDPIVVSHTAVPLIYNPQKNKPDIYDIPTAITQKAAGYEVTRNSGKTFIITDRALSLSNELKDYPNIFFFDRTREKEMKLGFNSLLQRVMKDLTWRYRKDWEQDEALEKWNNYYNSVIEKVVDPKNDVFLDPVRDLLKSLTGISYSDLEISLVDIEQPFSKGFFSLRQGTNQITGANLGSGISILLSFLLLETVAKRSKEEIIILVDEPELHLHPQLQNKFYGHFLNAEHQTIYTTQSDCFLNIADWRAISRFTHSGEKKSHSCKAC